MANRVLRSRYPALCDTLMGRAAAYNGTVRLCEELVNRNPQNTVLLRPAYNIDSFEKSVPKLEATYQHGYALAQAHMDDIRRLFD